LFGVNVVGGRQPQTPNLPVATIVQEGHHGLFHDGLLPGISSYAFGFNNRRRAVPVKFNDPTGLVGDDGPNKEGSVPPRKKTVDRYGGWIWTKGEGSVAAKPQGNNSQQAFMEHQATKPAANVNITPEGGAGTIYIRVFVY
jgi:hypothetical protein